MSDPEKQAAKSASPSIADTDEKGRAVNIERVDTKEAEAVRPKVYNEHVDTSHIDERKLLRKLDWWLVPWLSFLYLLSFLDRTSIGNAKVSHTPWRVVRFGADRLRSCTAWNTTWASMTRSTTSR